MPWRRVGIAAGLVLLVALAGYLFTSVPVKIDIDPVPQRLDFQGGWPGVGYGGNRLVRPGKYTLIAEQKGYEPLRVPIEITRDGKRQFRFSLKALPGRLRIELPVAGKVSIDGKPAGNAPGEFKLAGGPHKILIDTERYLDFATDIEIEGKDVLQRLAPKLVPGWAVVSITSEPAGAEASVGGDGTRHDARRARADGRESPARAAPCGLQDLGQRHPGQTQRTHEDRPGAARHPGRSSRGAQLARRRQCHDWRRIPRPHAARSGCAARRNTGRRRVPRGLRVRGTRCFGGVGCARGDRRLAQGDPRRGDRPCHAGRCGALRRRTLARRGEPDPASARDRARDRDQETRLRHAQGNGHAA